MATVMVHDVPPVLQLVAANEGAGKPCVITDVKLTLSLLRLGQLFSAVAVMPTWAPEVDPFGTVMLVVFDVTAIHGMVPAELSKVVPV